MAQQLKSTHLTSAYDNVYAPYAIPNIIDTSLFGCRLCNIGAYLYKSVYGSTKHTYAQHIKGCIEPDAGAHYYVQSAYSTAFAKATAVVDLSKVSVTPKDRNAFISLSLSTGNMPQMRQCDFGLGYYHSPDEAKEGWYPSSWSRDYLKSGPINIVPVSDATNGVHVSSSKGTRIAADAKVKIELIVKKEGGQDIVIGNLYNLNGDGNPFACIKYTGTYGSFFSTAYSKPLVRFVRFMSLVPKNTETVSVDDRDYSRLSGTMSDLTLYSSAAATAGTAWNKDYIEYAWSVQGANIEKLQISDLTANDTGTKNADVCSIYHRYDLHPVDKP